MRKFIIITFFSLVLFSLQLSAQQERTLRLFDFRTEVNGEKLPTDQSFDEKIYDNTPLTIVLVEADGIKLGAEYLSRFVGRRMKFSRRHFVEFADGTRLYAKRKKAVQMLKVSVKGTLDGRETETILYDRKQLKSIFISYQYELKYK